MRWHLTFKCLSISLQQKLFKGDFFPPSVVGPIEFKKKKTKSEQSTYFLKETGIILKIWSSSLSDGPRWAEVGNELKWEVVMCMISTLKYEYLIMFLLCHPKLFLWDFDCSWRKWIYSFISLNSHKSYSLTILQLSVIFLSKETI